MEQANKIKANPLLAEKLFGSSEQLSDHFLRDKAYNRNLDVLDDAHRAWEALSEFRKQSLRNKSYVFGDQWGDLVSDPDCGGNITEREYIKRQGKVPLTNNRIRGIVRSVLGLFSTNKTEPVCTARKREAQKKGETMSILMQYIYQNNEAWELDRRQLEYFLVSGIAIYRTSFGERRNDVNAWTDIVNYNRFFFDAHTEDPRMWDCNLVGQIHDISWYELLKRFANTPADKERLKSIYSFVDKKRVMSFAHRHLYYDSSSALDLNFFLSEDNTQCRIIEVWKKECEPRWFVHDTLTGEYFKERNYVGKEQEYIIENQRRVEEQSAMGVTNFKLLKYQKRYDTFWQCYFLSPFGDVLQTMESPYKHKEHPYSFKVYPYYDKKAHPFVADFIDQQRYINRIITMQDFIMGSSAKGVLMFPEEAKPSNMSMEEIADQWVRYNGVILYKSKASAVAPQQIVSQQRHAGATEMLQIQLKLLEDISGVQGALQGQAPKAGTPASLFMQQTQNAANSLTDILEVFKSLREVRDRKLMSLAQQFYTEARTLNVSGSTFGQEYAEYNPREMADVDFELVISESTASPAFRAANNELLMNLFNAKAISVKQLLEVGAFPFADKLLQSINAEEEKMMQAQQQGDIGQMLDEQYPQAQPQMQEQQIPQ